MIEILAQIHAPRSLRAPQGFTAGIVLWDDVVIEAAPIVHYMKRQKWTRDQVRDYCNTHGWEVSIVHRMIRTKE